MVEQKRDMGELDQSLTYVLYSLACFYEQEQLHNVLNSYLEQKLSELTGSQEIRLIDELRFPLYVCACCGYESLRHLWDICSVCLWEDEGTRVLDRVRSPNNVSLGQDRANFEQYGKMFEKSSDDDQERFNQYERPADWQLRRDIVDAPPGDDSELPDLKPTLEKALQVLAAYFVLKASPQELCDFINSKPTLSSQYLEYHLLPSEAVHKLIQGKVQPEELDPVCCFWAQSLYIRLFADMSPQEQLVLFTSFNPDAVGQIEGLD